MIKLGLIVFITSFFSTYVSAAEERPKKIYLNGGCGRNAVSGQAQAIIHRIAAKEELRIRLALTVLSRQKVREISDSKVAPKISAEKNVSVDELMKKFGLDDTSVKGGASKNTSKKEKKKK